MPAFVAGMQLPEASVQRIEPGGSYTRELNGSDVHYYALEDPGDFLVTVDNLGRGTILTIVDAAGTKILRTANSRGPEASYSNVLTMNRPLRLEIAPDEAIAPPGKYRISVRHFGHDEPYYTAERAMTLGADFNLRHYFGEADERKEALAQFLVAAREFRAGGNDARHADALFEAACAHLSLGEHDAAMQLFIAAESVWTSLNDQRGMAAAEMLRGLVHWQMNEPALALDLFREAARRRHNLGDNYFYAQAMNNMGLVYRDLGDARNAIELFSQALKHVQGDVDLLSVDPAAVDFSAQGNPPWLQPALIAMNNIGWAYEVLADLGKAKQVLSQALALADYLERGRTAAELRNNIGRLEYKSGNLQTALNYLDESLAYFTSGSQDEIWAAAVHQSKALVYRAAGETARAELELREALRLRTEQRDPVGRAETMKELAELSVRLQQYPEALAYIDDALELLGGGEPNRLERASLHDLAGRVYLATDQQDAAIKHHNQAVDLYANAGDLRGEAIARANRALAHLELEHDIESFVELRVALALAEQVEDRLLQFRILTDQGRIHAQYGDFDNAFEKSSEALTISEELRNEIVDPILLRDFASTQRDAYDVLVHASLGLGDIEGAWLSADAARARRFADLLVQPGFDLASLNDLEQSRYQSLLYMRAAREDEASGLLSQKHPEEGEQTRKEKIANVKAELASIVDEIERLQARARSQDQPPRATVTLADLQSTLDDDEIVLEYYLGELGGGAWRISQGEISYRAIPAVTDLMPVLMSVITAIRKPDSEFNASLINLSKSLLGEDIHLDAAAKHIIVIPDGALYYLPFSILLDPDSGFQEPLVESREITYLPSVATLFELMVRERNIDKSIAIVADPVYTVEDPRVRRPSSNDQSVQLASLDPDLARVVERSGGDGFARLPGTRNESSAITAAAADMDVLTVLDTDANREMVINGRLNRYSILHFATHGILDAEEPALSGLVLSGVDADGTPRAQFLRSQDIATLRLQANLVVLSACSTGLGRDVRGEGLVALSRAFFYAGAEQVVSSLWQVPDRATAELMEHFYNEMLRNGHSPAAALRLAMLALREDRRWRHPYYWAAFIVQGDWR